MKLRNIIEGEKNEENFNPEEYINLYTCVPPRPARGRLSRVARSLARSIEDALKEKKAPNEFPAESSSAPSRGARSLSPSPRRVSP